MRSRLAKALCSVATGLCDLPWRALIPESVPWCDEMALLQPSKTGSNPRPCSLSSHKPPFWAIRQLMTPASLVCRSLCCDQSGRYTRGERGSSARGACTRGKYSGLEVRDTHDFERVFAALSKGRPDGLYVPRTLIMSVRLIVAFYTLVDLF
jgi:hypothetical protein